VGALEVGGVDLAEALGQRGAQRPFPPVWPHRSAGGAGRYVGSGTSSGCT
jgi:hypothetical protein